jgi:hypothetical protein
MPRVDVKEIILENEYLWNQNSNYRSYCQDIADFFLPRKAWVTSIKVQGERVKFNFLYDSTGIRAVRSTSAGFHSNLTNPTTKWFGLEAKDKKLMRRFDVKQWFKDVEQELYSTLEASNFYNVIQEFYTNTIAFGTGTFLALPDDTDEVRYKEMPVGQVCRVLDDRGRLCELHFRFKLTARQAYKLWGAKCGEAVTRQVEKKPHEEFDFLHVVQKRYEREPGKSDKFNMPYRSLWIGMKEKNLIEESGFNDMPYISEVFYKDSNDPNGFSPAMDVLAEVKLVNAMQRTVIRGAMKQSDPPYILPSRGFVLPLNLNPAALNYRDAKTPSDALQPLPVGHGRIDISVDLIKMVQESINEGMFVPLFRSLHDITKQMTIPEVQRRVAESMALLGPVIQRMNSGVLSPTILRLYNIKSRNGTLPDPPMALMGEQFEINYLSPLAKAQRQSEVAEVQGFLGDVQAIGSIIPSAFDKINEDKTIEILHRMRGISPELLREDEEIKRMREQRAQQEALMAQLQTGGA